jgi:Na+-translocating ferredoxin:NAD+ oxidoreductase RNF subunit RnfB
MERKTEGLSPRRGLRLDADMSTAIAKLAEMDRIRKGLPGLDCRLCGAPTCDALAEDLVLGRGTGLGCKVTGSVGKG